MELNRFFNSQKFQKMKPEVLRFFKSAKTKNYQITAHHRFKLQIPVRLDVSVSSPEKQVCNLCYILSFTKRGKIRYQRSTWNYPTDKFLRRVKETTQEVWQALVQTTASEPLYIKHSKKFPSKFACPSTNIPPRREEGSCTYHLGAAGVLHIQNWKVPLTLKQ